MNISCIIFLKDIQDNSVLVIVGQFSASLKLVQVVAIHILVSTSINLYYFVEAENCPTITKTELSCISFKKIIQDIFYYHIN
jgi:hypothetical protein